MTGLWQGLWRSPSVLFATTEVTPLIKTGGLADVSRALPSALVRRGVGMCVVMPAYRAVLEHVKDATPVARGRVGRWDVEVLETELEPGLPLRLIAHESLFDRPGTPYQDPDGNDWPDNARRFACFCHAIAWLARDDGGDERPEIVHLNDWPTGPAAALLAQENDRPRSVFSIHNLEYQGLFEAAMLDSLEFPPQLFSMDGLEFHGRLSFMKGGLVFADELTTVSATYAKEIQTPEGGRGLDGLLRSRAARLTGIANGIDEHEWDPENDRYIAAHYNTRTLDDKQGNKGALQQELRLEPTHAPLFGVVTRLVSQKGMDLVLEIVDALVDLPAQLVVLGSGDRTLEEGFAAAAARHPGRVAYTRGFDERLAHLIEAGADVFLMPSRFEPCGLNQMYSMRYGTVPVVRRTGGLADTVTPVNGGGGTGFLFDEPTGAALLAAIRDAAQLYRDSPRWQQLQRNGMTRDFSWSRSAEAYLGLYRRLIANGR